MAGMTNRGKYLIYDLFFRAATAPTGFYLALVTAAVAPGADTNTLGQLTEIASGNGYTTGGTALSRNNTDFPTLTEDDGADEAIMLLRTVTWTPSGGSIPSSGDPARYLVLTTAEGTVANRQIVAFWDLGANTSKPAGVPLTATGLGIIMTETTG